MKKLLVMTLALSLVAASAVANAQGGVAGEHDQYRDRPGGAAGTTYTAATIAADSTKVALFVGVTAAVVALLIAGGDTGNGTTGTSGTTGTTSTH
jgi:hypothetical protein